MTWTKVLAQDALSEGARQIVNVDTQKIVVLKHQGQLYAIDNACPHLKLSMKNGKITADGAIVCPWHRSAFDLKTGNVKNWTPWPPVVGKALGMISAEKPLTVFPVRVQEGSIEVDI